MKIYNKIVVDVPSGTVVEADAFDYDGPVHQAMGGGGGGEGSSKPGYVIPGLVGPIGEAAKNSIINPAMGKETKIDYVNSVGAKGNYTVPMSLTDINMQRAINQVRGGYGARGLAGSGIAIGGEQNAIGQLALQGQQQNQQALTNLLAAGTGNVTKQESGGSGVSVVCTEVYRRGRMPVDMYIADDAFGRQLPAATLAGYHRIATPVVGWMRRSKLVFRTLTPLILLWGREMQYRITGVGRGSVFGKVVMAVGLPVCNRLGRGCNGR